MRQTREYAKCDPNGSSEPEYQETEKPELRSVRIRVLRCSHSPPSLLTVDYDQRSSYIPIIKSDPLVVRPDAASEVDDVSY